MIQAFVPFMCTRHHDDTLIPGKWYISTHKAFDFFGPYETEDAALKALPGVRSSVGTVCQTCED